jgi:hypothetical protein
MSTQSIDVWPYALYALAQWSTWKEAESPGSLYDEQALFFNAVVHAVDHSN